MKCKNILLSSLFIVSANAAIVYTTDIAVGTDSDTFILTDSSTGLAFATLTMTNDEIAHQGGGVFEGARGAGTATYTVTFTDADYFTTGTTTWASLDSGVTFGGTTNTGSSAGISVNADGNYTLDTTDYNWLVGTQPDAAGTNGPYLASTGTYIAGDSLVHDNRNLDSEADNWSITTTASDSQAITFSPVNGGIASEVYSFNLDFDKVPEPSSTALLGIAGLALLSRRRR